jgi:hypothetical protein
VKYKINKKKKKKNFLIQQLSMLTLNQNHVIHTH